MSFATPLYELSDTDKEFVYDPAEDSFLLLDALQTEWTIIENINPLIIVEIGVGSGIISGFVGKLIGPNAMMIGIDINSCVMNVARKTFNLNKVSNFELIIGDLCSPLITQLNGKVDLLLFNPPYVPTVGMETGAFNLTAAWAGGIDGRAAVDRLMPLIPTLLSPNGIFYVVALSSNKVEQLQDWSKTQFKLDSKIVIKRKCGIERLCVVAFYHIKK